MTMTKFEFIQEAALRLISVGAGDNGFYGLIPAVLTDPGTNQLTIGEYISGFAAEIADEVWKLEPKDEEQPKTEEPEMLTLIPAVDTVQVLANEIARLEKEQIAKENEIAANKGYKGWKGRPYRQASGADVRFLNCCHGSSFRNECSIDTVKGLVAYGRKNFGRRLNMGKLTLELVDKALLSLYNIKSW